MTDITFTWGQFTSYNSDGTITHETDTTGRVTLTKVTTQGDFKNPFPYSISRLEEYFPQGNMLSRYAYWDGALYSRSILPYRLDGRVWDAAVAESEDKALRKMVDILRGRGVQGTGHDLLVDLFESPELKGLMRDVRKIIHELKRLRFLTLMRRASPAIVAAEYYLLWKFGIEPLIQTYNEILKTLKDGEVKLSAKIKTTGKASYSEHAVFVDELGDPYDSYYDVWVRTSLQQTVSLADIQQVLRHQFGLTTPVSAFYATLPMSFVLDWFINVGSFLDTVEYLCHNSGYSFTGLFKSQRVRVSVRNHQKGYSHLGDGGPVDITAGSLLSTFDRTLLTSLPYPHLPSFRPNLGGGKLVSLFVLATKLLHHY